MWRTFRSSNTNRPAPLRHADGFPVPGLLQALRHPTASSEGIQPPPAATYPRDLPTRPGFPGFLADTPAPPLRPRPFCTRQRTAAPPDTCGHTMAVPPTSSPCGDLGAFAEKHGVRPPGPFPIPGSLRPDGSCIGGKRGLLFPKVLGDFFFVVIRKLYLAGIPRLLEPRLFPALSGELFRRRARTARQLTP